MTKFLQVNGAYNGLAATNSYSAANILIQK